MHKPVNIEKKKFKTGLVIGKFYPLHRGHQYLIETGLAQCEKLIVMVCHTNKYKIGPQIRVNWARELYPNADVRLFIHDPELDNDSPERSKIWAEVTVNFLGFAPDAVFTSENYGEPYCKFMGSTHVLVDKARLTVPVSGTLVRSGPLKQWEYLSAPVRSFFAKRIVIVGAESTGTTTLSKDLAEHYKTFWVPEYGRLYSEAKVFNQGFGDWDSKDFVHIACEQNNMENYMAGKSNKVLFCDTDSFATEIWHERYMGNVSYEVAAESVKNSHTYYILTDIDIPFVQDGLRDGEKIRTWMHKRFIEELTTHNKKFIIVSGPKDKRLTDAIKFVDEIISADTF